MILLPSFREGLELVVSGAKIVGSIVSGFVWPENQSTLLLASRKVQRAVSTTTYLAGSVVLNVHGSRCAILFPFEGGAPQIVALYKELRCYVCARRLFPFLCVCIIVAVFRQNKRSTVLAR